MAKEKAIGREPEEELADANLKNVVGGIGAINTVNTQGATTQDTDVAGTTHDISKPVNPAALGN